MLFDIGWSMEVCLKIWPDRYLWIKSLQVIRVITLATHATSQNYRLQYSLKSFRVDAFTGGGARAHCAGKADWVIRIDWTPGDDDDEDGGGGEHCPSFRLLQDEERIKGLSLCGDLRSTVIVCLLSQCESMPTIKMPSLNEIFREFFDLNSSFRSQVWNKDGAAVSISDGKW